MSGSLYRQYRPQKFSDVVAQEAARDVLVHALTSSRIGHAYLFSGPRGCGKTSVARILAKALNCLNPQGAEPCCACRNCEAITAGSSPDVVEIDGASNNSVEEVRQLKTQVPLVPFASKYKVYIIDEVHMLSTAAFNALLKTLEEPPSYVVFILATTEPHKLPVTIRSRCQHIPFHSIGAKQIFQQLTRVCQWEGTEARPEALWEVARQADGALRDALSMLEQIINCAAGEVTLEDVEAALGAGSRPSLERWLAALHEGGSSVCADLTKMMEGGSPQHIFEELFSLVKNLWLVARWPDMAEALDISEQEKSFLVAEAPRWSARGLSALLRSLIRLITQSRLGVRTDVLTGLFLLDLAGILEPGSVEPAPSAPREHQTTPANPANPANSAKNHPGARPTPAPQTPAPQEALPPVSAAQVGVEPAAEPVSPPSSSPRSVPVAELPALDWAPMSEDEAEKLLVEAREADFVLWCALLDATPARGGEALLLDMGHRYPFETLSLERWRAGLAALFSRCGGGVFLRFRDEVRACSPSGGGGEPPATEASAPTGARGREREWDGEGLPEPAAEPVPKDAPPPQGGQEEPSGALPFSGLIRDISRLMKGEVLLVRREAEEDGDGAEEDGGEED